MKNDLTEIAYILDRSGSMQSIAEAAISGFNSFLKEQQNGPGHANLTLALFDDEYLTPFQATPLPEVPQLDASTYVPRGTTALLDAIGTTINTLGNRLAKIPEAYRPGHVIIAIFTDGYENASTDFTARDIQKMITHQRKKYSWEFIFLAANQDAIATAASMGIAAHSAAIIQNSKIGKSSAAAAMSKSILHSREQNFYQGRVSEYSKPSLTEEYENAFDDEL